MARTRGRPKSSDRDDVTVKMDRALATMARMIASAKGIPLVEYLSEAARPVIERDFVSQMKKLEGKASPPAYGEMIEPAKDVDDATRPKGKRKPK